jgi:hypothetical protein
MKSLFATLVIVGLATSTMASEALNREGSEYLREATTAIPLAEKYRHRENLGLEEEEEEGIYGARDSKKSRSESLEKLLRGRDKKDRGIFGKKKHLLGEEALLTRDINKDDVSE